MVAAAAGNTEIGRALLEAGARPGRRDEQRETALDLARTSGEADTRANRLNPTLIPPIWIGQTALPWSRILVSTD